VIQGRTGRLSDRKGNGSDRVTVAVYRALATAPGRGPATDPMIESAAGWHQMLSEMPMHSQAVASDQWRGRVDALALRARFSNATCYARHQPAVGPAQILFSLLEQVRVEILGASQYPGVSHNLAALAGERWIRSRPEVLIRNGGAWIETFALLVRMPLSAPLPPSIRVELEESWRTWMSVREVTAIEGLAATGTNQEAFALESLCVIDAVLGVTRQPTRTQLYAKRTEMPQIAQIDRPKSETPGNTASRPEAGATGDPLAPLGEHYVGKRYSKATTPRHPRAPYRVYTRAFDSIVHADDLYDASTLRQGRQLLDRRVGSRASHITRWAHRLQRALMAMQMRSWDFDSEEGLLDVSRLVRIATHPLQPLVFKQEKAVDFPDTVVTLLVDQSGSMHGVPIATAAVCSELLGRVLECCGVKTEILGFTTNCWHGGRARKQWVSAGSPALPGRLTELRHIIYKSADEPWRRARVRLGAMCQDDVLKENVDGEAVLWAYKRLLERPEPRRVLMTISDGAPLDDATLEANDPLYLDRHLCMVIEHIERQGAIELAAIGIGHDVTGFYRRAITLSSVDELGEAMVAQLVDLFSPLPRRRVVSGAARPRTSAQRAG
jgi:cobaltochelatase CobT